MPETNNQTNNHPQAQPDKSLELLPPMSKEEADGELKQLGVTQDQLDMDISQLDMNDLVDPEYLPAIAARMMREGQMLNFKNPQVMSRFAQIVNEAFEQAQAEYSSDTKESDSNK